MAFFALSVTSQENSLFLSYLSVGLLVFLSLSQILWAT